MTGAIMFWARGNGGAAARSGNGISRIRRFSILSTRFTSRGSPRPASLSTRVTPVQIIHAVALRLACPPSAGADIAIRVFDDPEAHFCLHSSTHVRRIHAGIVKDRSRFRGCLAKASPKA